MAGGGGGWRGFGLVPGRAHAGQVLEVGRECRGVVQVVDEGLRLSVGGRVGLPATGLTSRDIGCDEREQPLLREVCIRPAAMVASSAVSAPSLELTQDAAQSLPGPLVQLRRSPLLFPRRRAALPPVWASPLGRRLAAHADRIEFASATDGAFTSNCSPHRLSAMQLFSVIGRRAYA